MANNITVKDSANGDTVLKTTDNAGVHTPHHIVDSSALPTGAATSANQTTIIGHLDGVETALAGLALESGGNLAAIATDAAAMETLLTGIDGDTGAIREDAAAIEALLTTIDADTGNLAGAVIGSEVQVDVVAALPAGTNNIGDVDVLTLPRSQSGPGQPGTAVDSYTHAAINLGAGNNQSLVAAPGANKQIWVYGLGFVVNAAGTVALQDEDDTAITGVMPFAANSGLALPPSGNFSMPLWKVATNKALEMDIVTSELDGWICYAVVSV